MIKKYINELVSGNNRVIVPDFGAFMVQDTTEGKVISFNDFLKFNDGLLVNHIIKSEKVNKSQALDLIKEFVKEVELQFSQGKSYPIENLGELVKDAQGNIKFAPVGSSKPADKKEESPIIILDEKKAEDPIKEEPVKPVVTEAPKLHTEKPTVVEAPKTEAPKPQPKPAPAPTEKPQPAPAQTAKPTAAPTKTATPQAKPVTVIKTKKKSSALNKILVVLACLIIVAAGVWTILTYHLINRFMPAKEAKMVITDTVEMPALDTTPTIDTTAIAEAQPQTAEEPAPKVVEEESTQSGAAHCYIITGSFKVMENAEKYSNKLKQKGFEPEVITRDNGFNAVSIKAFATKKEAIAEWQQLKEEYPGAWILIK